MGRLCYTALFTIEILSADGHVVYSWSSPVYRLTSVQWNSPDIEDEVHRLAAVAVSESSFGASEDLPEFDRIVAMQSEGQISYSTAFDRCKYDRLRASGWPTYTHQVGEESFRTVILDLQRHRGIVVLDYGL
jgi:hypothetical protein